MHHIDKLINERCFSVCFMGEPDNKYAGVFPRKISLHVVLHNGAASYATPFLMKKICLNQWCYQLLKVFTTTIQIDDDIRSRTPSMRFKDPAVIFRDVIMPTFICVCSCPYNAVYT